MTDTIQAEKIADNFAAVLRAWLSPAEFAEMKAANETQAAYASGACASHDYCDSNMAMLEAFESVMGRGVRFDNADSLLMGEAWNIARAKHIGTQA